MADITVIAPRTRHSPCVGICKLDDATGYCLGCARSGDEIGRWSGMSEAQRDAVWAKLTARHETLKVAVRLLPWMAGELMAWVVTSMTQQRGTWVVGGPGAFGEFPCIDRAVSVSREGHVLLARAADASFRLEVRDQLRAFEIGRDGPVVLGLPKVRGSLPVATSFAALGPDDTAVRPEDRGDVLFDMGLGRKASRFCLRAGGALRETLAALAGRPWPEVMSAAGIAIFEAMPHRVVESRLARVEVYAPIPLPGMDASAGAKTVFLPEHFKAGAESEPELALPEYVWPVATFYPAGSAHNAA